MCYALNRLYSQEQSLLSRGVASASPEEGLSVIQGLSVMGNFVGPQHLHEN